MKKNNFNAGWSFWENKDSFALIWNIPDKAITVDLPYEPMILNKAYEDSTNGGSTGFRDSEVYTYVKLIDVSESDRDKVFKLQFEGIYMNALVYVNGQLAGKNPFGYSRFNVSLNRFLKYGAKNEIRVEARSGAMTNSRWYTGAGIYRDVYLLESGLTHISADGVRIKTENIDCNDAVITVATDIKNTLNTSLDLVLVNEIYFNQTLITKEKSVISTFDNEERTYNQRILIEDAKLWNEDSPNLYKCVSKLYNDKEELIDENIESFGIRTLSVDAKKGLRVNGQEVKLRGACIHHDSGLLGANTYFDAQYRQIKLLKDAGFNAIRSAHQPISVAMLKACDELGMYVMDELSDIWTRCKSNYDYGLYFDEWWQFDLESMVKKDYNHPSVVMYSLGNEIPEAATKLGVNISSKLNNRIKELDDTRHTLISLNAVFAAGEFVDEIVADVVADLKSKGKIEGNVNHFMQLLDAHLDDFVRHDTISGIIEKACATTDIAGYNYMTGRYEMDGVNYPNRVIVGSETYPPDIARNWGLVEKLSHIIGDFTWTGWDYIGEAGVGIPAYKFGEGGFGAKFPAQLAYCGDFDLTGRRRPLSYYREIVFGRRVEPYIAVQNPAKYGERLIKTPWILSDTLSSWTYEGFEGKPVVTEVYACGDEVELILNGKSLGKKQSGKEVGFITKFEVEYQKGELIAVVYEKGKELSRTTLSTVDEERRLVLTREDINPLKELIYVNIDMVDSNNVLVNNCNNKISLLVEGAVEVLGFGSGNPKTNYNYNELTTELFLGQGTIILKAKGSGKVVVAVTDEVNKATETIEFVL